MIATNAANETDSMFDDPLKSLTVYTMYVLKVNEIFVVCIYQESDYFTPQGEFRVDSAGSKTLLNCLMYKLSYFRFGELQVRYIT